MPPSCLLALAVPALLLLSGTVDGHEAVASLQADKLDMLKGALLTIKSGSVNDMAQLKVSDERDRAKVLAYSGALEKRLERVGLEKDKAEASLDNMDLVVLPQLLADSKLHWDELEALGAETLRATDKHNASLNSSDARAVALLHDYNSIMQIAQHVADTIHNQDAMQAAVSAYSVVSDRVGYTGKRLQTVCKSREEMTVSLQSLMAHMEVAKEAEAAFRSNITADYNKYMEKLLAQRATQEKAISAHDAHLIEAQAKRAKTSENLLTLEKEHNEASKRIRELADFVKYLTRVLEDRLISVTKLSQNIDRVVRSLGSLKVKANIRAVTTA